MSTTTPSYERRHHGPGLLAVLLIAVLIVGGIWLYNRHNSETIGDHIGSAIDAVPVVVEKAADEVTDKDNYTEAGQAIENAGDKAGSALSKAGKATSEAVRETSNDIDAAADKQKQQDEDQK